MNKVYKVGDKFITLVRNELRNHEIGDILTIKRFGALPDRILFTKEDVPDSDWWFTSITIKEFLIPYDEVDEKSLFTAIMTGQYPGRDTVYFTNEVMKKIEGMAGTVSVAQIDRKCWMYFYMKEPA